MMTQEERVRNLLKRLRRCYRFIHARADGGRASQTGLLRELRFHGAVTQRMLRDHMQIQQSSLSELVQKMEEQALIVREVCPTDRRQIMISLTEAGIAKAKESEAASLQQSIAFMQVLSPEEQETLLQLLSKLDDNWTKLYRNPACQQEKEKKE